MVTEEDTRTGSLPTVNTSLRMSGRQDLHVDGPGRPGHGVQHGNLEGVDAAAIRTCCSIS